LQQIEDKKAERIRLEAKADAEPCDWKLYVCSK